MPPTQYPAEQPQIVVVPGGGARYLPAYYNGQQILWRSPWAMPGELVLVGGKPTTFVALAPAIMQNSTDKPFEIHDFRSYAEQSGPDAFVPIAEPAPGIFHWWKFQLKATGLNEDLTNNEVRAAGLFDVKEPGAGVWPWYMPFTLEQTQGFQAKFAQELPVNSMRIGIVARGYLLTLGTAMQRGGQPG
jgi:hypothetical protein